MKMNTDSHKKSKDEAINISKLHEHIKNNTPSGIKIKNAFASEFADLLLLRLNQMRHRGCLRLVHSKCAYRLHTFLSYTRLVLLLQMIGLDDCNPLPV